MDTETEPKKEETKPEVDPFIAELNKSFQAITDPNLPLEPVAIETHAPASLSERVMRRHQEQEQQPKDQVAEQVTGEVTEQVTGEEAEDDEKPKEGEGEAGKPEEKPEPKDKVKVRQSTADKLRSKLSAPPPALDLPEPPPVKQPAAKKAEPEAKPEEDPFIASLGEEEREELEFAKYASEKFPEHKSKYDDTKKFFQKLDDFIKANPDADPDSEEFTEFLAKHRPQYKDRNKINNSMVRDRTMEEARKEWSGKLDEKSQELERKIRELEVKPAVKQAVDKFAETLAGDSLEVPDGIERFPDGLYKTIKEEGRDAAAKKYPIEAPIYSSTVQAAEEFIGITKGIRQYDQNNPVHQWLADFIFHQEDLYEKSKEEKIVSGRKFVGRSKMANMSQAERAKHWAFTDEDIIERMGVNARIAITDQYKTLEAAGFARPKIAKPESEKEKPEPAAPEVNVSEPSPKAGTSRSPGPGTPSKTQPVNAAFMEGLFPGASKLVGG